jgi:hypothetical protein
VTRHAASLDAFTEALRDELHEALEQERPVPDVADVVQRALAIDAKAVPPGFLERLPTGPDVSDEEEYPELGPFAAALRTQLEAEARHRRLTPIPRPPTQRRPAMSIVTAATAIAAAVLLSIWIDSRGETIDRGQSSSPLMGAEQTHRQAVEERELQELEPETSEGDAAPPVPPAPEEAPPDTVFPSAPPTSTTKAPNRSASSKQPTRKTHELDDLEARAREHWRQGNLLEAEKAFRVIISRADDARADLAYGDLFSLERQRGGRAAQAKVWREYLRRFPRGRFAEDARAGLCGHAADDEQLDCWRGYLEIHPDGSHSSRARAALEPKSE